MSFAWSVVNNVYKILTIIFSKFFNASLTQCLPDVFSQATATAMLFWWKYLEFLAKKPFTILNAYTKEHETYASCQVPSQSKFIGYYRLLFSI